MMVLLVAAILIVGCVQPTGDKTSSAKTTTTEEASVDTDVSEIDALDKELDSTADIDEIDKMLAELE